MDLRCIWELDPSELNDGLLWRNEVEGGIQTNSLGLRALIEVPLMEMDGRERSNSGRTKIKSEFKYEMLWVIQVEMSSK